MQPWIITGFICLTVYLCFQDLMATIRYAVDAFSPYKEDDDEDEFEDTDQT